MTVRLVAMYNNNSKVQSPRKKKRKYSIDNNLSASSSTSIGFNLVNSSISEASRTVNIIDRILDFSKFSNADQADLYTLSRDWLRATNMEPRKKHTTNNPEPMNVDSTNTVDEHSQSSTISSDEFKTGLWLLESAAVFDCIPLYVCLDLCLR